MARLAPFHSSILLIILLTGCTNPELKKVNEGLSNILTKGGITYLDKVPFSGVLFQLSEAGDTLSTRNYLQGKPHGTWKQFYPNQVVMEVCYFENGKKTGVYKSWWPNGQLKFEYHFQDGEYKGNCKDWLPNGQLVRSMNYELGHEAGLQQLWTDEGEVKANYVAKNGRNYGNTGVKGCATLWNEDEVSSR